MDDSISRQAAIDVLEERLKANGYSNATLASELNRCIGYLMRLPSVDAVEVVRCKDCKHSTEWYGDRRRCFLWCEDGVSVFEDGFCNYWEQKDGKQDGD